jgi:pimeloyl-ACP methyl ester carboxylesterase
MRYAIPVLARQHRVIAIDLLGYGFSARPANGDYSLSGQAELVRKVMDALGIAHATVLGHSMGGAIAMQFTIRHPERVDRLVLVASATVREMRGRVFGLLIRPFVPLFTLLFMRRGTVRRALRRVVHDPAVVTEEMVDAQYLPFRMKGHMRAAMKQLNDRRKDSPFDARAIRQPTLLIWGEHDRVIRLSTGKELDQLIPSSRLLVSRSAGHLPLEEQPDECNRWLVEFLGDGERTAVSSDVAAEKRTTTPVQAP